MGYKNDDPCLQKAGENEPLFVLRGQDQTAPLMVLDWIRANFHHAPEEKLIDAFETAIRMKRFPNKKLPD